jgi:hypothetical protein
LNDKYKKDAVKKMLIAQKILTFKRRNNFSTRSFRVFISLCGLCSDSGTFVSFDKPALLAISTQQNAAFYTHQQGRHIFAVFRAHLVNKQITCGAVLI